MALLRYLHLYDGIDGFNIYVSTRVKGRTAKAIRVLERLTRAYARIKVGEQASWKQARSCETIREGFFSG